MFDSPPTCLERALVQAAKDLRVTGFGQRTRAALRRNRSAQGTSVLPYSMYKDVAGPDLVRHLNAFAILQADSQPLVHRSLSKPDRELFIVLRDQLPVVKNLVAVLWSGPLSDYAEVFIDYDNLPIPFCPMYPEARDLIDGSQADALPQPISQIVGRLRDQLQETPIMKATLEYLPRLQQTGLRHLKVIGERFKSQVGYRQGETLLEWQTRVHQLVATAKAEVPVAMLRLNSLIHSMVSSVVSLAVWDHELASSDITSAQPWRRRSSLGELRGDQDDPVTCPQDAMAYGPSIPDGYVLSLVAKPELMLLPIETCVRLCQEGEFGGIGIVKGASLSWRRDEDVEVGVAMVRLSAYEVGVGARGVR